MANSISVCMIVRNEEKRLKRCLDSLQPLEPKEIIVIDTGSIDETVKIARNYGGITLLRFSWEDDFSRARNAALNTALGDWILSIDADETLDPEGIPAIKKAINDKKAVLFLMQMIDTVEAPSRVPRLFRNDPAIKFRGRIHETVIVTAEKYGKEHGMKFKFLDAKLHHDGYGLAERERKSPMYENLYMAALKDDPKSISVWFHYGLFCLSRRKGIQADLALSEAVRFVKEKQALDPEAIRGIPLYADAVAYHALFLMETNRFKEAISQVVWSQKKLMGTPFLLFIAGRVALLLKQYDQALKAFMAVKDWGTKNVGVAVRQDQLENAIALAEKGRKKIWTPGDP